MLYLNLIIAPWGYGKQGFGQIMSTTSGVWNPRDWWGLVLSRICLSVWEHRPLSGVSYLNYNVFTSFRNVKQCPLMSISLKNHWTKWSLRIEFWDWRKKLWEIRIWNTDKFSCGQLLESFQKMFPTLNFPPLPERGDFDLTEVLKSPYFFNWPNQVLHIQQLHSLIGLHLTLTSDGT